VKDPAGDGDVDNTDELAQVLQPYVDRMTAQGIDKIVLLSHLQQYQLELELAPKLSGVDVVIAGGSHALWANDSSALRPGDAPAEGYPVFRTGADGNTVAVVNTSSEYFLCRAAPRRLRRERQRRARGDRDRGQRRLRHHGRGGVRPVGQRRPLRGRHPRRHGPLADDGGGRGDRRQGRRCLRLHRTCTWTAAASPSGTQETNFGSLTSDANLDFARSLDPTVAVSIKNGGGIRAEIGTVGTDAVPQPLPPQANPDAGKPEGGISRLDIENGLRFNNGLSLVTVTADG
jgi:hypothetical protein